uniref:Si:ch211-191a24.4 n=1 Tax=Oryzias latipes TaxID=8090 RepID=A0A3P9IQ51_ORYLA
MLLLRTAVLGCGALRCRPVGWRSAASYVQGQSPDPRIREYFYYVDHQGQLFLDDTKVKNFVTCFKDKQFLVFFFSRLRSNQSGRYEKDFPFLSMCGRERNFLRCDDRPMVFTHLLQSSGGPRGLGGDQELLSFCGGGEKLAVPFRPEALYMHPTSGRVYHPCLERVGGVGLVRSALAIELSPFFVYPPETSQSGQPSHFLWGGEKHTLTNELAAFFPGAEEGSEERQLE